MTVVKQLTLNRHANAGSVILGLGCPLITGSGNSLTVGGDISLSFGNQQTYVENTQISRISDYENTYALCVYNNNMFYWQEWDSSSRRGIFVYEKINNESFYGYDGNGTNWSTYPSFYNLDSITMNGKTSGEILNRITRLNYPAAIGYVDYANSCLGANGNKMYEDPNFLACSAMTAQQVITINGNNYLCLGPHIMIPMETE